MDSYFLTVKYIFHKNQKENRDSSIDEFFKNGTSFPQFVGMILGLEKTPGAPNPSNDTKKKENNFIAMDCLRKKDGFFNSFNFDFNKEKDQIALIQLVINRVYFKINRSSFLKKCNEYLSTSKMQINSFSEFITGNGFTKLLNFASQGRISSEMKEADTEKILNQLTTYFNSLNIPIVINKSSFLRENQDSLMYQALIIIDSKVDLNTKLANSNASLPSKEINPPTQKPKFININESTGTITNNGEKQHQLEKNIPLQSTSSSFFSSEIMNLPKSSYLNIVDHFLEPKKIQKIKYFQDLNNGTILPNLVESLLNEKVPNIVNNPTGKSILDNNMNSLYFINTKYPSIRPENYVLRNEDDQKRLIRNLMMKCIFSIDYINKMKIECNSILKKFGIQITNFNKDWENGKNFVALLNFISDGKIQFPPTKPLDIEELKSLFSQANFQFIIEKDSLFGKPDEFVILYQIRIILISIGKLSEKEEPKLTLIKQKQEEAQSSKNFEYIYEKNSNPILRVLNVIGSEIGLHYNSIEDVINGMTLHLLVKHLMKVIDIPDIKEENSFSEKNIDTVLTFLKKNNTTFKYSSFDFQNKIKRNENINLFSTTLLKQFFLKNNETQMMEIVSEFVGKKVLVNDMKQFFLYGKGFLQIFGVQNNIENLNKYDEKLILETFQKESIPFILDANSLTIIKKDNILFQLQLIFNREQKKKKIVNLINSIQNSRKIDESDKIEFHTLSIQKQKRIDQLIKLREEIPKSFLQIPNFHKNVNENNDPQHSKFKINRSNSIEIVHIESDSLFVVSNDVVFNQDSYNKFRSLYKITNDDDSIYIILIAGLNSKKVPDLIKIISGSSVVIAETKQLEARLYYCGKIEKILSHYNLKGVIPNSATKNHLACISITGPSNEKLYDFLYFEAAIASQCDSIIIPEDDRMNEKLYNVLNMYEQTKETKKKNLDSKFLLLFDKNYGKTKNCILNYNDSTSCSKFISKMISMFTSSAKNFDDYFKNINQQAPNRFFVSVFQGIEKEKNSDYKISPEDKDEVIINFIEVLSRNKLPLSSTPINNFFSEYQIVFVDSKSIIDILKILKIRILDQFAKSLNEQIKLQSLESMKPSIFCKEIEDFINNEITYIDEDYIEILKDSVKENIKDFIYNELKKAFSKDKFSNDLVMPIYKIKLQNYENFINDCMEYIDKRFKSTQSFEEKDIEIDQKQIKQDSMRYVLAVKESIKELTVEVVSESNLEKEIQQDF